MQEGPGYICRRSSKPCRVHAITAMAKTFDSKVLMIPHASTAFGNERISEGKVGIVGIACVMHWHPEGIETCIDMDCLQAMLELGKPSSKA